MRLVSASSHSWWAAGAESDPGEGPPGMVVFMVLLRQRSALRPFLAEHDPLDLAFERDHVEGVFHDVAVRLRHLGRASGQSRDPPDAVLVVHDAQDRAVAEREQAKVLLVVVL